MSTNSNIEWTEATWNPVAGCTPVSPGCLHCYAATMSHRLQEMGQAKYQGLTVLHNGVRTFNGTITLDEKALNIPLKRKKPTTYFVNSMSDLFHEGVPFDYVDKVFAVMALCPRHTFQVLTKRAGRMAEYLTVMETSRTVRWGKHAGQPISDMSAARVRLYTAMVNRTGLYHACGPGWPLPNVWLGVSVENQKAADERIPELLKCPAAVRFLSVEPMLEAVDLGLPRVWCRHHEVFERMTMDGDRLCFKAQANTYDMLHWVIVGGESGPGARPCNVEWLRSIVGQCKAAGVPVFVKQLGATAHANYYDDECRNVVDGRGEEWPDPIGWDCEIEGQPLLDSEVDLPMRDSKGGDPAEWPEDLRVREMPEHAHA